MKKIISLILVAVMLMATVSISASAENRQIDLYYQIQKNEHKYRDRVQEYVDGHDIEGYAEFHHYSDENSEEPDWVLIVCILFPDGLAKYGAIVGDRALWTEGGSGYRKIQTGITVYLPQTDTFIELENSNMDKIIELCPEFVETIEENKLGQQMGDVNENGELDILDATYIQIELAGYKHLKSYPWRLDLGFEPITSTMDADMDGEVSILDATEIQLKLARLI